MFLGLLSAESEISSQCQRNCESSNIHRDFRIDVPLHPQTIAPQPHCFSAPYLRLVSLSLPTFLMPFMPCLFPHKLSFAASRLHGSVQLHSAMLYVSSLPPTFPWIVLAVVVHSAVRAPCFSDVVFQGRAFSFFCVNPQGENTCTYPFSESCFIGQTQARCLVLGQAALAADLITAWKSIQKHQHRVQGQNTNVR